LSLGEFTLAEGAVSDLAQQAGIVVQRANVAPVDRVRIGVEVVSAEGLNARQEVVDPTFGGEEGFEGFLVRGGGAAGCDGVISCSLGCGLASGEGRFQCGADRPYRRIVEVEPVGIAGFQRLDMEMFGGDLQQQDFLGGFDGGCSHGVISGAWAVLRLQSGSLYRGP
jgi:hypothetical protein